MILKLGCMVVVLAACSDGNAADEQFDNRVEAGSTWQLDYGSGALVDGSSFSGPCPTLASETFHVQDDNDQPCDAGCSCTFFVWLDELDNDAFGEDEWLSIELVHECNGGTISSDDRIAPTETNDVAASWRRSIDTTQSDCAYPLHLTVTFATP